MTEKIGCVQHDCAECKARLAQPTSGDYALGYTEGFNDACKRPPEQWISLTEDEIYTLAAAGHAVATTRLVNEILKGKNP